MKLSLSFKVIGIITLLLTISPAMVSAQEQNPETLLQAAINAEIVEGNLEKAIQLYEQILERFSSHRSVAARALLRLGQSHEKLGNQQAQEIYERLIRDYSDQGAIVVEARARLTALRSAATDIKPANTSQVKYLDGSISMAWGRIARNGEAFTYEAMDGNVVIQDLMTGQKQTLTSDGNWGTDKPDQLRGSLFCIPSRDASHVAVLWEIWSDRMTYELRIITVTEQTTKTLKRWDQVDLFIPLDWSPDGQFIVGFLDKDNPRVEELVKISTSTGSIGVLSSIPDPGYWEQHMEFAPDGRFIAYDILQGDESDNRDIYLISEDGTSNIRIVENQADDYLLGWDPEGKMMLFCSDRQGNPDIWGLEIRNGVAIGEPILLHPGFGDARPMGISQDGNLYYSVDFSQRELLLQNIDRLTEGPLMEPTVLAEGTQIGTGSPVFSQDGRYLAYTLRSVPDHHEMYIRDLVTGSTRILNVDIQSYSRPVWAPDNRHLLIYGTDANEREGLFKTDVQTNVSNLVIPTIAGGSRPLEPQWSTDGQTLFFSSITPESSMEDRSNRRYQLVEHHFDSGIVDIKHISDAVFRGLSLSPDGDWLAYYQNVRSAERNSAWSDWLEIYVLPTGGGEPRQLVIIDDPRAIVHNIEWNDTGNEVLLAMTRWELTNTGKDSTSTMKVELWTIPIEGGNPKVIGLDLQDSVSSPYLAPNGEYIIYSSIKDARRRELWVLRNFIPNAISPDDLPN